MWLVDSFECMMMHGLANPKMIKNVYWSSCKVLFNAGYPYQVLYMHVHVMAPGQRL